MAVPSCTCTGDAVRDDPVSRLFLVVVSAMAFVAVLHTAFQSGQTSRDLGHAFARIEALEADRHRIAALESFVRQYRLAAEFGVEWRRLD